MQLVNYDKLVSGQSRYIELATLSRWVFRECLKVWKERMGVPEKYRSPKEALPSGMGWREERKRGKGQKQSVGCMTEFILISELKDGGLHCYGTQMWVIWLVWIWFSGRLGAGKCDWCWVRWMSFTAEFGTDWSCERWYVRNLNWGRVVFRQCCTDE